MEENTRTHKRSQNVSRQACSQNMDQCFSLAMWICLNLNVSARNLYAETDSGCVGQCFSSPFIIETVTLGRGERSCATCRSATRGTVRRLGSTRWEAIASIIIVSDMALQMNARTMVGTHRGGTHRQTDRGYTRPPTIWTCINNMIFRFSATEPTGRTHWLKMRTVFCEIMFII